MPSRLPTLVAPGTWWGFHGSWLSRSGYGGPLRWPITVAGTRGGAMDSVADREFAKLAGDYLDDRAQRHPDEATDLGDHRFDDRMPDSSQAALADERRALDG